MASECSQLAHCRAEPYHSVIQLSEPQSGGGRAFRSASCVFGFLALAAVAVVGIVGYRGPLVDTLSLAAAGITTKAPASTPQRSSKVRPVPNRGPTPVPASLPSRGASSPLHGIHPKAPSSVHMIEGVSTGAHTIPQRDTLWGAYHGMTSSNPIAFWGLFMGTLAMAGIMLIKWATAPTKRVALMAVGSGQEMPKRELGEKSPAETLAVIDKLYKVSRPVGPRGEEADVTVVGAGPAGLALTLLLSKRHGISVNLVDSTLEYPWGNNYGTWLDEAEKLAELFGTDLDFMGCMSKVWQHTDVYFGGSFDIPLDECSRLERPYVRLDRLKLKHKILEGILESGKVKAYPYSLDAKVVAPNLFDKNLYHDGTGSSVTLSGGVQLRSKYVVDCTGFGSKLIAKEGDLSNHPSNCSALTATLHSPNSTSGFPNSGTLDARTSRLDWFLLATMAVVNRYATFPDHFYSSHNVLDGSRPGHFPVPSLPRVAMAAVSPSSKFSEDVTPPSASNSPLPSNSPPQNRRTIAKTEKYARLPVWPAWNGVALFLLGKLFGAETAAKLEDAWGGRVCPNFFKPESTSPFIMLVHHRHSFAPWDPLRYIQRTFFAEGFPAHPHRGFITVTYILKGGFEHRDSMGIQQYYGSESRHDGKHTQWLTTGAGLLHEEMWDISPDEEGGLSGVLQPSSQELYQLWLNVPSRFKLVPPKVELLGGEAQTPTVTETSEGGGTTRTIVIAGEHAGRKATVETYSDLAILHVMLEKQSTWRHEMPASHQTGIIYVRRGSISISGQRVPTHHTAYLSAFGSDLVVEAGDEEADFLFLAGEPLNEPVAAQGAMVMTRPEEINEAYADYQMGKMGVPWDHKLTDEEWMEHITKFPSRYQPESVE